MNLKTVVRDVPLWLSVILGAVFLGATVFQMMVLVPEYYRDIPNGMIQFAHGPIEPKAFWASPLGPVTAVIMIVTLITNWRTPRRTWIILSFVTVIAANVFTFVYFVPRLRIMGLLDHVTTQDPELLARTINEWVFADEVRFALLVIPSFLFMLKALTIPASANDHL